MHESEKWKRSHSVVSNSSRPHGLQPTRILHLWDSPGKSTGVGCHHLLCLSALEPLFWLLALPGRPHPPGCFLLSFIYHYKCHPLCQTYFPWLTNKKYLHLLFTSIHRTEEQEIKLPTSVGSSKKQESSRKTSTKTFDCVDHNKLWKILKEMGIPDHLTCLLRNLYAGQEVTVRTGHGTTDRFQIGKRVCQGHIVSCCLFNLHAEYIMRNAWLDEAQAGIRIARRNVNNLRYADYTIFVP